MFNNVRGENSIKFCLASVNLAIFIKIINGGNAVRCASKRMGSFN